MKRINKFLDKLDSFYEKCPIGCGAFSQYCIAFICLVIAQFDLSADVVDGYLIITMLSMVIGSGLFVCETIIWE